MLEFAGLVNIEKPACLKAEIKYEGRVGFCFEWLLLTISLSSLSANSVWLHSEDLGVFK